MISSAIIATVTACIPLIARTFAPTKKATWYLPVTAGVLFLLSFRLPEIPITSQTSTFTQHAVGGGVYCALLFVYFAQLFRWDWSHSTTAIILFAWVSAFGAANELLELLLNQLGVARINLSDTNWDILANTMGAFIGYYGLMLMQHYQASRRHKS